MFSLEQDQDGYPPYREEGIWVRSLADSVGEVLSIPFFVTGISKGDFISYDTTGNEAQFSELLSAKGHSTLRLILSQEDAGDRIRNELESLGCGVEMGPIQSLLAVDIPPRTNYTAIIRIITKDFTKVVSDYEEACISREHR
ncbi:DUF4265 domain-containing protein [Streptosporangium sp. NBC_01469]|uniref:DUF4265 domain-containing protein n=1 Tax=Streptosporangium sp. NBC_01469 TaxID=2903898 RepID=UPI002E2D652E|nr:DUF4265 domain-containing protein [Streptosporangium sp. NBC_01469]